MYLRRGIIEFRCKHNILSEVSHRVAKRNHKLFLIVYLDCLLSTFLFGTIYTEYEALNFVNRRYSNRKTYVTCLWLLETFKRYNRKESRTIFSDKRKFNTTFSKFINRQFIDLNTATEEEIILFLKDKEKIVLKNSSGCSGKQVLVMQVSNNPKEILEEISAHKYDLMEQCIENCSEIAAFNPTSLNTLRIVTIHSQNYFKVVFACLRIGAIGSKVDNVSCGGASAIIDLESGKLKTVFCTNSYREIETSQKGRDDIGFTIPYWNETIGCLEKATKVVPDVHIIGWDVAITNNGPVLIEGNDSFGATIMQYYYEPNEPGLKSLFMESLKAIDL